MDARIDELAAIVANVVRAPQPTREEEARAAAALDELARLARLAPPEAADVLHLVGFHRIERHGAESFQALCGVTLDSPRRLKGADVEAVGFTFDEKRASCPGRIGEPPVQMDRSTTDTSLSTATAPRSEGEEG